MHALTYQIIYSSQSTFPMESDDLEDLLEQARSSNGLQGISGALVYTDGVFLQILEGERVTVQALMAKILRDVRHEAVSILRGGEVPFARFQSWKMAYVSATREQVARWAGIGADTGDGEVVGEVGEDRLRTAQFADDILALLAHEEPGTGREQDARSE